MLVELLTRRHARDTFACGKAELDSYIREPALQDMKRGLAHVFVLVDDPSPAVLGYYSLSAFGVQLHDLPQDVQARLGRYPAVPATLLGRLAVTEARRGHGLGEHLLMDALRRAESVTAEVASVAVIVDAIDDDAAAFYARYDFRSFAGNPRKLFLPMSTIKALGL